MLVEKQGSLEAYIPLNMGIKSFPRAQVVRLETCHRPTSNQQAVPEEVHEN